MGASNLTTQRGRSRVQALFSFPDPVNEVSARLVAAGVVVMCVLTLAFNLEWATVVIAYGFVARVLTGPTLSPLGQLVTRFVTPRLGIPERPVPGPPKRFAQGMGVAFSVTALVLTGLGYWTAAEVMLGLLASAAFLESAFGLCLGCKVFADPHARRRRARGGLRALQRHLGHATTARPPELPRCSAVVDAGRRGCSCRRACPGSPG